MVNKPEGPGQTRTWLRLIQTIAGVVLLAWRFSVVSPQRAWRDILTILALLWIYAVVRGGKREAPMVLAAVAAFLLGIYAQGQVPLILRVLGVSS